MRKIKITIITAVVLALSVGIWFGIYNVAKPLIAPIVAKVSPTQLTTEQKLEDFDYLYNTLKENYPYFEVRKRMIGYDWLAHKDEFRQWVKETKNDREYYDAVGKIISLLQSGHTNLVNYSFYQDVADLYSDPLKGYSPARRNILKSSKVVDKIQYWDGKLTGYDYYIPLIIQYVEGNYVVFDGELDEYGIPKGSIVKKIGDQDIEDYVASLKDKIYLEYDYKRNKPISRDLYVFTGPNEKVSFVLQTPSGETITKSVKEGRISDKVYERYYNEADSSNLTTKILENGKTAYIRMRSMAVDAKQFDEDKATLQDFLQKIQDYPYLIIDIRGNGGGNTAYWSGNLVSRLVQKSVLYSEYIVYRDTKYITPFINDRYDTFKSESTQNLPENKNYPPEIRNFGRFIEVQDGIIPYNPFHFKGKIYLLVDGGVYSAAESFATFAKTTKWATLVGTTTGGDGIGAEPGYMALPNSGILIRIPVALGLNPDGTINEEMRTQPDLYVEQSYQDVLKQLKNGENPMMKISKNDTVLNYVLDLIKNNK